MSKLPLFTAVAILTAPSIATAQIPFQCGPDCSTPGRYVLCNDSFDAIPTSAGAIRLSGWLDAACVVFPAPEPTFDVVGFAGLFGDGEMFVSLVEVFDDDGNAFPPAPAIGAHGAGIPFSAQAGFSGLLFAPSTMTGPFRLCTRQQIDDVGQTQFIRPLAYDDDGMQNTNYVFLSGQGGWQNAADNNVTGDFILRPIVTTANMTPWEPGGECDGSNRDGGVPMQNDAGNNPQRDAGFNPPNDGGTAVDAGEIDAGPSVDAPTITAISPKEGDNTAAVDILVTGTNFLDGLSLKIGSIGANQVTVAGATTINGKVPTNIAPGVYDVIVTNPDGQSAILANGYTVLDKNGGGAPVAEGCGCTNTGDRGSQPGSWLVLLSAWIALLWRRRR